MLADAQSIINSLAGLWEIVAFLCGTFLLWLFRDPIRKRGLRLQHRDTALELPPATREDESDTAPDEAEVTAPPPPQLPAGETPDDSPAEGESAERRMYFAALGGDLEAAHQAFEEMQEAAAGDDERLENEVRFAFLRARYTPDPEAFGELQRYAHESASAALASNLLGVIYEEQADYDSALAHFERACEHYSIADERVNCIVGAGRSLAKAGRQADAVARIGSAFNELTSTEARAALYRGLGETRWV